MEQAKQNASPKMRQQLATESSAGQKLITLPSPKKGERQVKVEPKTAPLPDALPTLPVRVEQFLKHVSGNPTTPVRTLLRPFLEYESVLRSYLAQKPDHEFVQNNTVNLISVFEDGNQQCLGVRVRDLASESQAEKEKYIMPLGDDARKKSGEPALITDMEEFKSNFNVFTEGAFTNTDDTFWSNLVVAGSSCLTPMLVPPKEYRHNKRGMRKWYHDELAPASDIDLFIYGIDNEEDAIKKMAAIEKVVQDNLLWETTTFRTRNTITIVSQYPNRHVQIVLRLYKSISQILTGFDVDCACFAYDGKRVLANPRALVACLTQCNAIDLSRRSPSYENRLSKYSRRGFEVYCDFFDRSRVDPTIFERSFGRTVGLARLLVLEALPTPMEREDYQNQRRRETGRPENHGGWRPNNYKDVKERVQDETAEWDFEDVSSYQKFAIPYGSGLNAKNIEKMFFRRDLVLNSEWNKANRPPHRTVKLHRHPAFFGELKDVIDDCCGECPEPIDEESRKVAEEEDKIYVNGKIKMLKYGEEDPGRQEIGSFDPLGPEDYTEMAYVGSTAKLCEAIVSNGVGFVAKWCETSGTDINSRDFCGRTPLHLACLSTSTNVEIAQCLIDHGAKLIARLQDGRTALHLAAQHGRVDIVSMLLKKSAQNEQERDQRLEKQKASKAVAAEDVEMADVEGGADEMDVDKEEPADGDVETVGSANGSAVKHDDAESFDSVHMSHGVSTVHATLRETDGFLEVVDPGDAAKALDEAGEGEDEDDIYDINIEDWDNQMSPLHHAIIGGHTSLAELLISDFGADPRRALRVYATDWRGAKYASTAILNLTLAINLTGGALVDMVKTLLRCGASSAQFTKLDRATALHYFAAFGDEALLRAVFEFDAPGAMSVINHGVGVGSAWELKSVTPLISAMLDRISKGEILLENGARANIKISDTLRYMTPKERLDFRGHGTDLKFLRSVPQPLEYALEHLPNPNWIRKLIENGADPSTMFTRTWKDIYVFDASDDKLYPTQGTCAVDFVREQIEECQHVLDGKTDQIREPQKPQRLFDEGDLSPYPEGSYQRYLAEYQVGLANNTRRRRNKELAKRDIEGEYQSLERKKAETERYQMDLKEIENMLIAAGGKTYHEIRPEAHARWLEEKNKRLEREAEHKKRFGGLDPSPKHHKKEEREKLFVPFAFNHPFLGEGDTNAGYIRLFDAVWKGGPEASEIIKTLCLGASGEGDRLPPLHITATEKRGFNLLTIATIRGHHDLIPLILEIADSQYEPPAESEELRLIEDDDESSDDDIDDVPEPIDDADFAVEEAGAEVTVVKSNISPWEFLTCSMVLSITSGEHGISKDDIKALEESYGVCVQADCSLLEWAVYKNDLELFRRLFTLATNGTLRKKKSQSEQIDLGRWGWPNPTPGYLELSLRLGRIEFLEEIMCQQTFGIPYSAINVEDEETRAKRTDGYYYGLTVRGKKRQDWTRSAAPAKSELDNFRKPLQIAVNAGNIASVEWLYSDRPHICLDRFLQSKPHSWEAKILERQGDGLKQLYERCLGLKTNLLAHIVIAGWHKQNSAEMLKHLYAKPNYNREVRSNKGHTLPLYAVVCGELEAVKTLVSLGADFSARDKDGKNIIHLLLERNFKPKVAREWLETLPKDIIDQCWTQKTRFHQRTPLAHWLDRQLGPYLTNFYQGTLPACCEVDLRILKLILEYSKGRELGISDNQGNLVTHTLFQRASREAARVVLGMDPTAIARENANGRTPLEIANALWLRRLREETLKINEVSCTPTPVYRKPISEFPSPEDEAREKEKEEKGRNKSSHWDVKGCYALAREFADRETGKRNLVSLGEANELAQRLAGMKKAEKKDEEYSVDVLSLWSSA